MKCLFSGYLKELHSLLRGPGLWVGGSEDPELSLDQGAVDQVHLADVEVDDSVVRAGCRWLHGVCRKRNQTKKDEKRSNKSPLLFRLWDWGIVSDIITHDERLWSKLQAGAEMCWLSCWTYGWLMAFTAWRITSSYVIMASNTNTLKFPTQDLSKPNVSCHRRTHRALLRGSSAVLSSSKGHII